MLRNTENSVIPYSCSFSKNALSARFTVRPVAGSKAKRAELAFQAQTGIPFYAFFS
jgi:hypothetical protein